MRAGRLRHRITIQQPVETKDSYGAVTISWSTFATVWAAVEPISGKEFFQASQVQSEITHRVTIRYLFGVTAAMRVLHEGRTLELTTPPIDRDERHIEMQLMCREVT